MATHARKEPLLPPRQTGRYRFVLTPLADAMFQLLIFFMLSSNLAPYSLLTIRSGPAEVGDGGQGGNSDETALTPQLSAGMVLWNIEGGQLVVGGQVISFERLPELASALSLSEAPEVLLILRDDAAVQDLATVMEALSAAGITAIQIAAGAA